MKSSVSRIATGLIENGARLPRSSVCVFCQHSLSARPAASTGRTFHTSTARRYARPQEAAPSQSRGHITQSPPPNTTVQSAAIVDELEDNDLVVRDEAQVHEDTTRYADEVRRQEKKAAQAKVTSAPLHHDYVPATTWDGLQTVGGERELPQVTARTFKSFLSPTRLESTDEITVALYRAAVEIFAALGAGYSPRTSQNYTLGTLANAATLVKLENTKEGDPEGAGKVRLSYPSEDVAAAVLAAGSPSNPTASATLADSPFDDAAVAAPVSNPVSQPQSLASLVKSFGHSWFHISLENPKVKFALIKRIARITGRTVPDHIIHNAPTIAAFHMALIKPQKPPKLFETLSKDSQLTKLPNVTLAGRRQTPIDKEMQVGRWKLIEAELQRRNLPVTGRG